MILIIKEKGEEKKLHIMIGRLEFHKNDLLQKSEIILLIAKLFMVGGSSLQRRYFEGGTFGGARR